jgi:hypothetical protein
MIVHPTHWQRARLARQPAAGEATPSTSRRWPPDGGVSRQSIAQGSSNGSARIRGVRGTVEASGVQRSSPRVRTGESGPRPHQHSSTVAGRGFGGFAHDEGRVAGVGRLGGDPGNPSDVGRRTIDRRAQHCRSERLVPGRTRCRRRADESVCITCTDTLIQTSAFALPPGGAVPRPLTDWRMRCSRRSSAPNAAVTRTRDDVRHRWHRLARLRAPGERRAADDRTQAAVPALCGARDQRPEALLSGSQVSEPA